MFDALFEALKKTGIPFVKAGFASRPKGDYGVLRLDGGAGTLWADGQMTDQAVMVSVDLFTRGEGRDRAKIIQGTLAGAGVSFRLADCQYEEETGLTHFTWDVELEAM